MRLRRNDECRFRGILRFDRIRLGVVGLLRQRLRSHLVATLQVDFCVFHQRRRLVEFRVTILTVEGFLAGVYPEMRLQVAGVRERFAAHRAHVLFDAQMDGLVVAGHVVLVAELLAAQLAHFVPDAVVQVQVAIVNLSVAERLVAFITLVFAVGDRHMGKTVIPEMRYRRELFSKTK